MTTTRKTWISILIASVIIAGMLAVSVVGSTVFFIYRHINSQITPAANAEEQLGRIRERFAGQQPLIEVHRDDAVVHRVPTAPRHELHALHALAYDRHEQKLVHIDVPLWLMRLMPSGTIHISDLDELDGDRTHITLDDLERHGPGIVLDVRRGPAGDVLVWTE